MSFSRPRSPVGTNDEEPPLKKKASLVLTETTLSSLSDDLVLSFVSRLSISYYPTLSLVSKSFRSLVVSPELYKSRSLLGRTESCLYVCLRLSPTDPNTHWFKLSRRPIQTVTSSSKKSSGYVLAALPIQNSPPAQWSGLVAVGSNIYNIGGLTHNARSSSVSVLDCMSHTWREAPSMLEKRYCPTVTVLDGKIYVARGCKDYESSNWMEVFDPETQAWEPVLSSLSVRCRSRMCKSLAVEDKIYMFAKEGVSYKPKEDKWEVVAKGSSLGSGLFRKNGYCVIDDIIYRHYRQGIKWYNFETRGWRMLKGLDHMPFSFNRFVVALVSYGGKMVVFWDDVVRRDLEKKKILCAVITLRKYNNGGEIWGKIQRSGTVLEVPSSYELVRALVATV